MLKILLLGRNGQLAWELRSALAPLGDIVILGSQELNLGDGAAIQRALRSIKPQVVVNAAAYNYVDQAEEEPQMARLINATAPGILAEEVERLKALLVHYSTDYVFDGTKTTPYSEEDQPCPVNVYGQTKLDGELNIRAVGASHLILRTCWLYGARGNNFLLTMLRLAREKDVLYVVNDQVGSPTWVRMVAGATAQILSQIKGCNESFTGTYHLSAGGQTSWHGFAQAIFDRFILPGDRSVNLMPITASEFKSRAIRPAYSVLSCKSVKEKFGISLPKWDHTLALVMEKLANK